MEHWTSPFSDHCDIIGDEEIGLAIAIGIEPCRTGSKIRIVDTGRPGDIPELAIAFVVKQMISIERGDVEIGLLAVVVVVGNRGSHAIHGDIEAAAAGHIRKGSISIVAIESAQRRGAVRSPVAAIHKRRDRGLPSPL